MGPSRVVVAGALAVALAGCKAHEPSAKTGAWDSAPSASSAPSAPSASASSAPAAPSASASSAPAAPSASASSAPSNWPPSALPADVASHLHRTDKDVVGDPAIGYVIDRELLALVVCDPGKYLGRTRLLPAEGGSALGEASGGLRVVGDDSSTLLFALGVRDGDVIKEVRHSVSSSSDIFFSLMGPFDDLGIVLERDHHRVSIPLTVTGRGSPKDVDEASRIRKVTETERRIERGLALALAAAPSRLACTIRLVPEPGGLRVFGVRPGMLLGALGFENGDLITAIAGVPVRTTRDAVRGTDAVGRASGSFDVDLARRGKSLKLRYRVEP